MSWVCRGRIEGDVSLPNPTCGLQDGAAREATRDPTPVFGGAVKIIQKIDPPTDQAGGGRARVVAQPLAVQRRLRCLRTPCDRRSSRDSNANIGDRALAVKDYHSADTD